MVMRTTWRLSIYRNHSFDGLADPLHPLNKTRFKLLRVDEGENPPKRIVGRNPIGQVEQLREPCLLCLPKFLDFYPSFCSTEDSTDRQNDDIPQSVKCGFAPFEGLLHTQKSFPGCAGRSFPCRVLQLFRPILSPPCQFISGDEFI